MWERLEKCICLTSCVEEHSIRVTQAIFFHEQKSGAYLNHIPKSIPNQAETRLPSLGEHQPQKLQKTANGDLRPTDLS